MIGERLASLRKASGRSQDDMAKELGISRSGYQFYERNERDLPTAILLRLCEIFEDDPNRLLTGQPSPVALRRITEVSLAVEDRLEELDIELDHERKWRVIARALAVLYRMPEGLKDAPIDLAEIDELLRMVA